MSGRVMEITEQEAQDLRYLLDDADVIHAGARDQAAVDRILALWHRVHYWLMGCSVPYGGALSAEHIAHLPAPSEVPR